MLEREESEGPSEREGDAPLLLASATLARTRPLDEPIMPMPCTSSYAPTSSSASPNLSRFCSLRSSVCAYASLALRALRALSSASKPESA